jgi:hypothetical protein
MWTQKSFGKANLFPIYTQVKKGGIKNPIFAKNLK